MSKGRKIKLRECLMCNKDRMAKIEDLNKDINIEQNELLWRSDLVIIFCGKSKWERRFTVCRECRDKNTLNQIFTKLMGEKYSKTMEENNGK